MKLTTKELILYALLGAILVISQISLSFLPNIELISLFIIIFSLVYDKKILYSIIIFLFIMGSIYGFRGWWIGYLIIWPLLSIITLVLKKYIMEKYLLLSIFSGFFGLIFGFLYSIPYFIFVSPTFGLTYWIRGIPYDLIHMLGNYFIMIFLGKIIYNLLSKLNKVYF